jgi:hypothetical protein
MNGTAVLYGPGEQAALSLCALVACPLASALVYYLARRRQMKVTETLKSRAYVFYRFISGLLLGQVVCHTQWDAASLWLVPVCVAGGYFLLDAAEGLGRVWNYNPYFVAPADGDVDGELGLNRETFESESWIVSSDVTGEFFPHTTVAVERDYKDNRKRQWMLGTLALLMLMIALMDGFMLVAHAYREEVVSILALYASALSMSVAVYGAMIHAKFHVTEDWRMRVRWWAVVTGAWCVGLFLCTCLPVLVGMQWASAVVVTTSGPFVIIYGLASGALLKTQQYFHGMRQSNADRWDTVQGIAVFFSALAQSALTSVFL